MQSIELFLFMFFTIASIVIRIIPTYKNKIYLLNNYSKKINIFENILMFLDTFFTASNRKGKSDDELKKIIAFKILDDLAKKDNKIYEIIDNESKIMLSKIFIYGVDLKDLNNDTRVNRIIESNI